jgi:hypothetical protein
MKSHILFALLILSFPVFSQNAQVEWGQPFEADSRMGWGNFLGEHNEKYYNLKWEVNSLVALTNITYKPTLEVLDQNLNLEKKVDLPWDDKYGWLEGHLLREDELFFFGLSYDKDSDESLFREVKFDLKLPG